MSFLLMKKNRPKLCICRTPVHFCSRFFPKQKYVDGVKRVEVRKRKSFLLPLPLIPYKTIVKSVMIVLFCVHTYLRMCKNKTMIWRCIND